MTENQTEPTTEPTTKQPTTPAPTEPQEEPVQEESSTDPRLAAARKDAIKYRERAKTAEAHANELEQQNAQLKDELLGYERAKAITESCELHEGLSARDFNDFCTETDPKGMRKWADTFAKRLDAARTGADGGSRVSMSGAKALSAGNGGVYAGSKPTMRNAVNAAISRSF